MDGKVEVREDVKKKGAKDGAMWDASVNWMGGWQGPIHSNLKGTAKKEVQGPYL